jgi:AcrR family transcriptional regulator
MAADGRAEAPPQQQLTQRGQVARRRIVETAAELMFIHGIAGTRIDDVKAAAQVSSSQLYHYFADKHALVRAVITHQTETILAGQEPLLSNLDSMDALRAWRDLVLDVQRSRRCEGGCPLGGLASELSESDDDARADLAAGFGQWEASIRSGLRAMHDRGELVPHADPDQLALALLAAHQGGLLLTQVRRDLLPLQAALNETIDHIQSLRSKRKPPTTRSGRSGGDTRTRGVA